MTPKPTSASVERTTAMPILLSVRESPSGKHMILTLLDEGAALMPKKHGQSYTVSLSAYRKIGLPVKDERLNEEQMTRILEDDERFRATKQAIRLLAYADQNEKTLLRKLRLKGFSQSASEAAVRTMVSEGYLNEQNQLSRLVTFEANVRLCGPGKIKQKLIAKGFSARDVELTMAQLQENGTVDFAECRKAMLEKYLPKIEAKCPDPRSLSEETQKLLYKFGYKTRD